VNWGLAGIVVNDGGKMWEVLRAKKLEEMGLAFGNMP
jgi:hypothetical protein